MRSGLWLTPRGVERDRYAADDQAMSQSERAGHRGESVCMPMLGSERQQDRHRESVPPESFSEKCATQELLICEALVWYQLSTVKTE
eukprot:scaffold49_cov409-Prasinococcus_capsulatus_cf.AAC.31